MALTLEQWKDKLKTFVPAWWFETDQNTEGLFWAAAAVFQAVDQDKDDQFNATFITRATSPILDLIGDERSIERVTGESDVKYRPRIQQITSQTDAPNLKVIVDALLAVPGCKILESPGGLIYANRGTFLNRDNYFSDFKNDYFLVVVPLQVHLPYSFASRGFYLNRDNFAGTDSAAVDFFDSIVSALQQNKAFGVLFGVVESNYPTVV